MKTMICLWCAERVQVQPNIEEDNWRDRWKRQSIAAEQVPLGKSCEIFLDATLNPNKKDQPRYDGRVLYITSTVNSIGNKIRKINFELSPSNGNGYRSRVLEKPVLERGFLGDIAAGGYRSRGVERGGIGDRYVWSQLQQKQSSSCATTHDGWVGCYLLPQTIPHNHFLN